MAATAQNTGFKDSFAQAMTSTAAKETATHKPTAGERAQDGMSKGSIGGPYGAIFGAIDGYFNGPLYKTTLPKKGKGAFGMGSQLTPFHTKYRMPPLMQFKTGQLQDDAIKADTDYYARSDADYSKRHPGIVSAEKILEGQVAKNAAGDSELLPALQNEYTRAGLGHTLDSLGDTVSSEGVTGNTLGQGSAGEAEMARELGLNIMDFQDRNRHAQMERMGEAESLMPRRTFGFDGQQETLFNTLNNQNQNAWNQAWFADKRSMEQQNWQLANGIAQNNVAQGNVNAAANAQSSAATTQAVVSLASSLIGAYAKGGTGASTGTTGGGTGPMGTYTASSGWQSKYTGA